MRLRRALAMLTAATFALSGPAFPNAMIYGTDAIPSAPSVTLPSADAWFWNGNGTSINGTQVPDYWLNKVGGELESAITSCGYSVSMTTRNQLWTCIQGRTSFTPVQQGGGAGQGSNKVYLGWDGTNSLPRIQIDVTDQGDVAMVNQFTTSATSSTGYTTLPNGSVVERGQGLVTSGTLSVTLPLAYPDTNYDVTITDKAASTWTAANVTLYGVSAKTTTGFTVTAFTWNGTAMVASTSGSFSYIAYGK
jgi:hypothetical protein